MERILIADDDQELCELLAEYLERHDIHADCVHDGAAALSKVKQQNYAVLVLDVMMPKMDGLETLQRLRRDNGLPVIMLTARGDDIDRILGLEMGADDYLPKPANPRELLARIRAVLRRANGNNPANASTTLSVGELVLDPNMREAMLDGTAMQLTGAEFEVLQALVEQVGKVVSKEALSKQALGRALGVADRSLDMHISRLRRKLGPRPDGSTRIKSVRNRGYLYIAE